jgi:circadian clock protein KaiC
MAVGEYILDEPADRLREAVRRRGVKRLLIGGMSGSQWAAPEPGRTVRFRSDSSNGLRPLSVTTPRILEPPGPAGPGLRVPITGTALIFQVMAPMRHVGFRSRLHRPTPPLKVRMATFDPAICESTTNGTGIIAGKPFEGVEAVPGGVAQGAAQGGPAATRGGVGQGLTGRNAGHRG